MNNQLKYYQGRIPACGVFCGGCPVYVREKKPCPGAEINFQRCENCKTFHLCCKERNITNCFQCTNFPCHKFKRFAKSWLKYGQDLIENQHLLSKIGMDEFLKHYNSKIKFHTNQTITDISKSEYPELIKVWEASVRATHHFLKEEDILFFKKIIPEKYLDMVQLYAIRDAENAIRGFLGTSDDAVEMLFIHPDSRGKGIGSALLNYAVNELHLHKVDVNEQNEQALGFYLHKGFSVIGRSELDGTGKPYPLLHLEIKP